MTDKSITPLILCGGEGRRLQPLSTPDRPKPFLKLFGGKSLLQLTALRFSSALFSAPVVSCHEKHLSLAQQQLDEIGVAPQYIIAEPESCNTAPAIIASTLFLNKKNKATTLLAAPADHWIEDEALLESAIKSALPFAEKGEMVLFGVPPVSVETAYGYVAFENEQVQYFVEKPSATEARSLLQQGNVYWNSGMFMFGTSRWEGKMRSLCSSVCAAIDKALLEGEQQQNITFLSGAYALCKREPFDKAIIECSENRAVLPLQTNWSDVGRWESLLDILHKYPSASDNADVQRLKAFLVQRA